MTNNDDVVFYDAHPGLAGCPIRIPSPIKKIADELEGMPYSLSKAVKLLEKAAEKLGSRVIYLSLCHVYYGK